jgi:hypothetical protein
MQIFVEFVESIAVYMLKFLYNAFRHKPDLAPQNPTFPSLIGFSKNSLTATVVVTRLELGFEVLGEEGEEDWLEIAVLRAVTLRVER